MIQNREIAKTKEELRREPVDLGKAKYLDSSGRPVKSKNENATLF